MNICILSLETQSENMTGDVALIVSGCLQIRCVVSAYSRWLMHLSTAMDMSIYVTKTFGTIPAS